MHAMPPQLEVYYASTCAPCRVELPVLRDAVAEGRNIRIRIVSTPEKAMADFQSTSASLARTASVATGRDERDRLRRAGDSDGILPYSRSLSGNGRVCSVWRGMLTLPRIRAMLQRCL